MCWKQQQKREINATLHIECTCKFRWIHRRRGVFFSFLFFRFRIRIDFNIRKFGVTSQDKQQCKQIDGLPKWTFLMRFNRVHVDFGRIWVNEALPRFQFAVIWHDNVWLFSLHFQPKSLHNLSNEFMIACNHVTVVFCRPICVRV